MKRFIAAMLCAVIAALSLASCAQAPSEPPKDMVDRLSFLDEYSKPIYYLSGSDKKQAISDSAARDGIIAALERGGWSELEQAPEGDGKLTLLFEREGDAQSYDVLTLYDNAVARFNDDSDGAPYAYATGEGTFESVAALLDKASAASASYDKSRLASELFGDGLTIVYRQYSSDDGRALPLEITSGELEAALDTASWGGQIDTRSDWEAASRDIVRIESPNGLSVSFYSTLDQLAGADALYFATLTTGANNYTYEISAESYGAIKALHDSALA